MTKSIAILGAKESGVGAALLAQREGYAVWVSDFGKIELNYKQSLQAAKIEFEEEGHTENKILQADVIVKSPGVSEKAAIMKKIREEGKRVVSEIEFASWFTSANLIGITGTNGKTTTSTLIYQMMKHAGLNVAVAGNIGDSFARMVYERKHDHYVLEISSFQLDDIESFKPHIAVLLNITPDHLDRYENDLQKYAHSKFRITQNQEIGDYFIYCLEDPLTMECLPTMEIRSRKLGITIEKKNGAFAWVNNNTIHIAMDQENYNYDYDNMKLKGRHNMYNTMAAAIVGKILDIRKDSIRESFSDFRSVEHRLEKVAQVGGIEFINDSKATNVNAAWYALESVIEKEIIWIAGGVDKGNDYGILEPLVDQKVKAIIALGDDVRKLHQAFGNKVNFIMNAQSMEEAVSLSYHIANKGDVVMLSPACASFGMFENFEDRGRQFKKLVKNL